MRGLTRRLAAAGAIALASAASSPAWAVAPEALLAGASRVEVALPAGVPLGGYGGLARRLWLPDLLGRYPHAFWLRPSEGVMDPFVVRGLYLEAGRVRVRWLTVDLVGVDPSLVAELERRLGPIGPGMPIVLLSASHSHSGPGAYAESELFAFAAIDRPSPAVREAVLDGLARAAREAESGKGPATIAAGRSEVGGIALSRLGAPLDAELAAVKVARPDGRPVAVVWNYAIHGTVLSARNLLLSGDVTGRASAIVERDVGAPALYVNGAVADVSPRGRGPSSLAAHGASLAAGVHRALAAARTDRAPRLLAVARNGALPAPRLRLKNCVDGWAPAALQVSLARALPRRAPMWAIAIGSSAWVTVPGELQTSLGLEIKRRAGGPLDMVLVAGLTNGHLGYLLSRAAYHRPGYMPCASFYGERGGEAVRDVAIAALDALRGEVERR